MSELLVVIDVVCVGRSAGEVAEEVGHTVVRPSAHLDLSAEVHPELEYLHDIEVEVCPDVISFVAEILGTVSVFCVEETLCVEVSEIHIVACILVSAIEDDVTVNERTCVTEDFVIPVHIHACAHLIGLELLSVVCWRPYHSVVIRHRLVVEVREFI